MTEKELKDKINEVSKRELNLMMERYHTSIDSEDLKNPRNPSGNYYYKKRLNRIDAQRSKLRAWIRSLERLCDY